MESKENLHETSGIPLLTWHLPNKEAEITDDPVNRQLTKDHNESKTNHVENKLFIQNRCGNVKSDSYLTDSECIVQNKNHPEYRKKTVKQRRDRFSEDEVTKIGERLNHSLCMKSSASNNDSSSATQKQNYNLRDRKNYMNYFGVKYSNLSNCQQLKKKPPTKRKLLNESLPDGLKCLKRGRKPLEVPLENSDVGLFLNSSAESLRCMFIEMKSFLKDINQIVSKWIKGSKPVERDEAISLVQCVRNVYKTLTAKNEMIIAEKILKKKRPLQKYVLNLLNESEKLYEQLREIIFEYDVKHKKFTEEYDTERESLPKVSSSELSRNIYSPKKKIKSILKTAKNPKLKKSKKISFSQKYINIYNNSISQISLDSDQQQMYVERSLDSDQHMYVDEDSCSNNMDFDEININTSENTTESIGDNYMNKTENYNSMKKTLVSDSSLKENNQLSLETAEMKELTPNIIEQNFLPNKDNNNLAKEQINKIVDQSLQDLTKSQFNNTENIKQTQQSSMYTPEDYTVNYDERLSPLQVSENNKNQQLSTNINLKESFQSTSESLKQTENVEVQTEQINTIATASHIEKTEHVNEEMELVLQDSLALENLKVSDAQRNSISLNISQNYIQPTVTDKVKNNSNLVLNTKPTLNMSTLQDSINSFHLQKQVNTNEAMQLVSQNSLANDSLKAQIKSIDPTKRGKCFVKKQTFRKDHLHQRNDQTLLNNKTSNNISEILCKQGKLHKKNANAKLRSVGKQNSNNSNNSNIHCSTNFKTYKRKRIIKPITGELSTENIQPTIIQSQGITEQTQVTNGNESMQLKNDSKLISLANLTDSSISEGAMDQSKTTETSFNIIDKGNFSTDLKSPVNYVIYDPPLPIMFPSNFAYNFPNDITKEIPPTQKKGDQIEHINNGTLMMGVQQNRKNEMKNKESQTYSELDLLNSNSFSQNITQDKTQNSSCSETVTASFETIKSMRIKSENEFVIIQDLSDLITADEFIW